MLDKKRKNSTVKNLILLHLLMFFYSLGSIFSKLASKEAFLSYRFIFFYGLVLLILFAYAVFWQQILKDMNLITAYANKAVTVVWGVFWGVILFQEEITINNVIGIAIIIMGVYMVVTGEEKS